MVLTQKAVVRLPAAETERGIEGSKILEHFPSLGSQNMQRQSQYDRGEVSFFCRLKTLSFFRPSFPST